MKQNRRILYFLVALLCYSSQLQGQGFEIFLVRVSAPDFTSGKPVNCYYCFEPKKSDLYSAAFLRQSDVKYFDWYRQQIQLKVTALKKIDSLKIPLQGLAAAIVIDGEPIYGFWFWNEASSFGCDRVFTFPARDFVLEFGLPDRNKSGHDPRFDNRIEEVLIREHLMK